MAVAVAVAVKLLEFLRSKDSRGAKGRYKETNPYLKMDIFKLQEQTQPGGDQPVQPQAPMGDQPAQPAEPTQPAEGNQA